MTQAEIVDVCDILRACWPEGGLDSELTGLEPQPGGGQWLKPSEPAAVCVFRTIVWERDLDPDVGLRQLRDVKEQEVHMGWPVFFEDRERVAAYVEALTRVVAEIPMETFGELLPSDLIHPEVLKLKKARSAADFERALRAKSRLGQFLSVSPNGT